MRSSETPLDTVLDEIGTIIRIVSFVSVYVYFLRY